MGLAGQVAGSNKLLVSGTGLRVRRYPSLAIGITLTSDGAARVYPVGANVKAFVNANVIKADWRLYGFEPFTPSAAATEYWILLGSGAAAGAVLTLVTALMEIVVSAITVNAAQMATQYFPYAPTVARDDATDGVIGGMCSTNAAADTLTAGVLIATLLGT